MKITDIKKIPAFELILDVLLTDDTVIKLNRDRTKYVAINKKKKDNPDTAVKEDLIALEIANKAPSTGSDSSSSDSNSDSSSSESSEEKPKKPKKRKKTKKSQRDKTSHLTKPRNY